MDVAEGREPGRLTVELVPGEDEWGSRTDRWRADVHELQERLVLALPAAVHEPAPGAGDKGIEVAQVVVDLVSAGALTAAVEAMKVWLGHGRRSLVARWTVVADGRPRRGELVINAANVDQNTLTEIARGVFSAGAGGEEAAP